MRSGFAADVRRRLCLAEGALLDLATPLGSASGPRPQGAAPAKLESVRRGIASAAHQAANPLRTSRKRRRKIALV